MIEPNVEVNINEKCRIDVIISPARKYIHICLPVKR